MSRQANHTLDVTGLLCPEPVMMLHNQIRDIAVGETVEVIATDPTTQRDIPQFCHFLGHALLHEVAADGQFRFLVRKQDVS